MRYCRRYYYGKSIEDVAISGPAEYPLIIKDRDETVGKHDNNHNYPQPFDSLETNQPRPKGYKCAAGNVQQFAVIFTGYKFFSTQQFGCHKQNEQSGETDEKRKHYLKLYSIL